jgi:hypothetical protein
VCRVKGRKQKAESRKQKRRKEKGEKRRKFPLLFEEKVAADGLSLDDGRSVI